MSNAYGSGDMVRRLLEAYLASQQELAADDEGMTDEDLAALGPMLTGEEQNFAGMVPSYGLTGKPYTMNQQLNQLQDVNQLLADPLFQGGGGVGGWSQQAFAPTVNYEVVDSPEYQRWMNYLNTPTSPEGMIAAELQGGGTPMSAIRKIQQKVTEDPEGQLAQELATFFPALDFDGQPTGEIDWTKASDAATQIDEIRAKVPPIGGTGSLTMPDGTVVPAGEIMEVDGQLVKRTEEPSEIAQHFTELGLPSPFEEYSPASFLGPEWEAQNQAWQESAAGLDPYNQAVREAYEAMLRNEDWVPPAGPAPAPGQAGEGDGRPPVPTPSATGTQDYGSALNDLMNQYVAGGGQTPQDALDVVNANAQEMGLNDLQTSQGERQIEYDEQLLQRAAMDQAAFQGLPYDQVYDEFRQQLQAGVPITDLEVGRELPAAGGAGNRPQVRGKLPAGARKTTGNEPPEPTPISWPPTILYDPWAPQQATEQTMRENLYQPPPGGYATLEEAAAAGSAAARRYLEENGPTSANAPNEDYVAPEGGYPTLEQAAAAGSPAAIEYLNETGYRTPWSRPQRHPEGPLGGAAYEQQLAAGRPPPGAADDFYSNILEILGPQGTGPIPTARPQGGPPPSEAVTIRTGETGLEPETEDQVQQYLENSRRAGTGGMGAMRTGERTAEERRRLARARTDEDWEYDPTTGNVNMRVASRKRFKEAYKQRSHAIVARQRAADQIYGRGSGFGAAMAAAYRAQLSGATPLQQVYAQRVQNVANAGIPIGAQPGLISY